MRMYIFDLEILSKFNFNMATINTFMTTGKIVIKDSPYKWTPGIPGFFINLFYFSHTYFSNP